ncbi:hypothetical protein BJ322DRAFT_1126616 [Thelephora terrestris]|uniref:Uncharacterized protein n=1 Tax=Thelephora terrestris TaxID=56493 RepID=A0A9P6L4G9_9AGAM|nr:hypothetical protein BJ322DRAFT_1126616 [Thelephora terrestris]
MDRPAVHRSSLPQSWSQPYPHSAPPNHNHPRPPAPLYPHDQHNPYTAPALYPTVVSQQMPHRYAQPVPNQLIPGGYAARPRAKSFVADHNPYTGPPPPVPHFPSPQFPQAQHFPHITVPPPRPPAFQPTYPSYQPSSPSNQTQDAVVPIRPAPMSARRSSSSPAVNRIPPQNAPPPVPPLPPTYQSNNPQSAAQRTSPVHPPPPSIPIPSPSYSYRSDSSPLYESPYETASPVPPPHFPTGSPPRFESDVKRAPVDDEEEALALAIALSEKELKEQSGMSSQEEDDIARAIEESMKHASSWSTPVSTAGAGPSTFPQTTSPVSFPSPLPVSEPPVSPQMSLAPSHPPHSSASRPTSKASSPLMRPAKSSTDDDEAFAGRIAEEEERSAAAGPSNHGPQPPVFPSSETTIYPSPPPSTSSRKRQDVQRPKFSIVNSDSDPPPPLYHHVVSARTSVPEKSSPISPVNHSSLGRSSSASAVTPTSSRHSPIPAQPDKSLGNRSQSLNTVPISPSSAEPIPPVPTIPTPFQIVEEPYDAPPGDSPSSSANPVPANSFIDSQLLYGVSLGFNPPQISSIKTTLKGGVPNVISLPTGRYVPFHIQAPDWRHLLKMMARLSGSRIEPAVEVLAASKQEPKLRTVVQFVKVNATSQDWRTVIYMTIDNPSPSNAPHKFSNGDVNTLPWSYNATPLPPLLRDGPDTPVSKYYTIPATSSTPYPTLPISFPNMAMYLASAVEDSRRMAHDNSGGMKRLAKTLDMLYPAQVELGMEDDEPDKPTGVVNMFRNVFGRGRRDQRRNDDNYADLVTPFVPEWG